LASAAVFAGKVLGQVVRPCQEVWAEVVALPVLEVVEVVRRSERWMGRQVLQNPSGPGLESSSLWSLLPRRPSLRRESARILIP
jgi:hypothetical protein